MSSKSQGIIFLVLRLDKNATWNSLKIAMANEDCVVVAIARVVSFDVLEWLWSNVSKRIQRGLY